MPEFNPSAIDQLINELKARNLWSNCTNEDKLVAALRTNFGVYLGFDPTASSLHLGNYLAMTLLKRFSAFGIKTVALVGGATGMIGDPSFRNSERALLSAELVNANIAHISAQLQHYCPDSLIVNNADFYQNLNVISFLRDVGKLINVNYLLEKEALKTRLSVGLSYTEFTYPLIQGWDFVQLYQNYQVGVQLGGSDQWGNITTGTEMLRKIIGPDINVAGLTFNLLTDVHGNKFGKSNNNALFLDPKLTNPYVIYQFLMNADDQDVIKYLLALTFLPISTISELEQKQTANPKAKIAHKQLAWQVVHDLHGATVANACRELATKLFSWQFNFTVNEWIQLSSTLATIEVQSEIKLTQALVQLNLAASLAAAKTLITSQGVKIFNQVITNVHHVLHVQDSHDNYILVQKGKKTFACIHFN